MAGALSAACRLPLHLFELAGRSVRLWQRPGETYGHVLMKALGYAMFVGEYPGLEIELAVGLRYKPDLVALNGPGGGRTRAGARFLFWGECGPGDDAQGRVAPEARRHGASGALQG